MSAIPLDWGNGFTIGSLDYLILSTLFPTSLLSDHIISSLWPLSQTIMAGQAHGSSDRWLAGRPDTPPCTRSTPLMPFLVFYSFPSWALCRLHVPTRWGWDWPHLIQIPQEETGQVCWSQGSCDFILHVAFFSNITYQGSS